MSSNFIKKNQLDQSSKEQSMQTNKSKSRKREKLNRKQNEQQKNAQYKNSQINNNENKIQNFINQLSSLKFATNQEILQEYLLIKRGAACKPCEQIKKDYKQRVQIIQESMVKKQFVTEQSELQCPICMDLLINATSTICGHTFCERCLVEALLIKPGCPICRTNLRDCMQNQCKTLDFAVKHNNRTLDKKGLEIFQQRKKEHDQWTFKKKITHFEEGMKLDVRDTEFIWCQGIIKEIQMQKDDTCSLLIHYDGWNNIYDEFINENSNRLAPLGFFTSRNDIPKYVNMQGNQDTLFSYIIYGNNLNDNQQIQQNQSSQHQLLSAFLRIMNQQSNVNDNIINFSNHIHDTHTLNQQEI